MNGNEQKEMIEVPACFDEVYSMIGDCIWMAADGEGEIHELIVSGIVMSKDHRMVIDCYEVEDYWCIEGGEPVEKDRVVAYELPLTDVGKTIFFTREDAEKKLEEGW